MYCCDNSEAGRGYVVVMPHEYRRPGLSIDVLTPAWRENNENTRINGSSKPGIHIVGATEKDAGESTHARARIAQRGE